jgi:hypothetical protein
MILRASLRACEVGEGVSVSDLAFNGELRLLAHGDFPDDVKTRAKFNPAGGSSAWEFKMEEIPCEGGTDFVWVRQT